MHKIERRRLSVLPDTIGGLVGPWVAGPITDRLGRRGGMFIGAIIICIGIVYILYIHNTPGNF